MNKKSIKIKHLLLIIFFIISSIGVFAKLPKVKKEDTYKIVFNNYDTTNKEYVHINIFEKRGYNSLEIKDYSKKLNYKSDEKIKKINKKYNINYGNILKKIFTKKITKQLGPADLIIKGQNYTIVILDAYAYYEKKENLICVHSVKVDYYLH